MKRSIYVALMLAIYAAPATAAEPPCGTKESPAWCASLDGGAVTVVAKGERREYATAGLALKGPLPAGFLASFRGEVLGVQDGGALTYRDPGSFRAIALEASAARGLGESPLALAVRGGTTFSIEGGVAAPIDPRLWTAQAEAAIRLKAGTVRVYGGHDGAVGGWALGGGVEIPVSGAPAIVASYDYPLQRPSPSRPRPWVVTAGGRVSLGSFRLAGLF